MTNYVAQDQVLDLGDGLTIRRLRTSDAPAMSHHADDPDIARQMRDRFPSPYTEQDALDWIALCNGETKCRPPCPQIIDANEPTNTADTEQPIPEAYAIALHDAYIGGIGLMFGDDIERRSVEVGYWCKSNARRHYWQMFNAHPVTLEPLTGV